VQLGNSLLDDKFSGKRADFVLANPPFNLKKWGAEQVTDDARWAFGLPPDANANYAWIQHFIHHLTPNGRAGFVLANGSLTSNTNNEGKIREAIVRDDVVDCIVALPPQLFFTTGIPVCLWFLDRDKASTGERDRRSEILFIDARKMGEKISRTQIELTEDEIAKVAATYHAWRGQEGHAVYEDIPGYCASATLMQIEAFDFLLTPGRYVGSDSAADDTALADDIGEIAAALKARFAVNEGLAREVAKALDAVEKAP
jgi:type I restriction enzyme M protein